MKIGFICSEYPPGECGGIGIFTRELAEALVEKGHRVCVVGYYPGQAVERKELINGVVVYRLPEWKGRLAAIVNRFRLWGKVRALANEKEIECIEVPDFKGDSALWPKLPIPVVIRMHGSHSYLAQEMGEKPVPSIRFFEKSALGRADRLLAVSQYAADVTREIFSLENEIDVISNGVKIPSGDRCKANWNKTYRVAFSGSLMRNKGVLSLARAWPKVKARFPQARLVVIGKDTLDHGESVKDKIVALSNDRSIEFTGHVQKAALEKFLVGSDMAIYPSYSETFGLAPVESMALGVPTVCSTLSCGPEIIKDGFLRGHGVSPHDCDGISERIISILSDDELRQKLGKLGREMTRRYYSAAESASETEKFYKLLLGAQ